MKQKALALILALCMAFSLLPVAALAEGEAQGNPFTDVDDTMSFYAAVQWALEKGVTTGASDTTFEPNEVCTRAQAVTFLWRANGKASPIADESSFTDVPADAYYADAVQWAWEKGIVESTSETTFSPDEPCTRAEMIAWVWKTNGAFAPAGEENPFEDVPADASYIDAVLWANERGVISSAEDTRFDPDGQCDRAFAATLLYGADQIVLSLEEAMDKYWYSDLDYMLKSGAGYPHGAEGMGAVILAMKDGEVIFEKAYGYAHYYDAAEGSSYENPVYEKIAEPREMTVDTLFDLASVTKVMATTQSIMILVDRGLLDVNDTVTKHWPEFTGDGKENITVAQLLTHSSGLPQWEATYLYCDTHEEQMAYIENLKIVPEYKTDGSEPKYSDFSFMILGFLVEKITGVPMEDFVKENVYEPLGMTSTTYNPLDNGFTKEQIAATSLGNPYEYRMVDEANWSVGYDCTKDAEAFAAFEGWRNYTLIGEVNDGNTGMGGGGIAGHAGLFSTASDLAILLQCMLDGGKYTDANGVEQQLYSEETVKLFTTKHTTYQENHTNSKGQPVLSEEFGYAFKLDQSWMGASATENVFGHDGFTGTNVFADPDNNYVFVCLTNKMQGGFRKSTTNGHASDTSNYYNTSSWVCWNMNQIVKDELGI